MVPPGSQAPLGQATPPLETQVPAPSQALSVRTPLVQLVEPQGVVAAGYMQAPVASQPVPPHVLPPTVQAAVQQLPEPVVPQAPDVQASFSVQGPVASCGTQALALHQNPLAQSVATVQVVLQAVPPALHPKLFAQGTGAPRLQAPVASQAEAVSMLPVQVAAAPQAFPGGVGAGSGRHIAARIAAMSLAAGVHWVVQQFPVPERPQMPEVQAALEVQAPLVTIAAQLPPLQ